MVNRGGGSVYLARRQPEVLPEDPCTGAIECALAGVADQVLLLTWLAFLLIIAFVTLAFLPRARSLCDDERRCVRAEHDAFDRFVDRIRALSPTSSVSAVEPAGSMPLVQHRITQNGGDVAEARNAYAETVMAVPHFEEEYGETIGEHMRAELSEEVAHATLDGTSLGPHVKRGLVESAIEARERRAKFLNVLDEEASSLERHQNRLHEVELRVNDIASPLVSDQTFSELRNHRDALRSHEASIESVIESRQADRRANQGHLLYLTNDIDLQSYLYQPMDISYPVFAEAAHILSQIDVVVRRIEGELIYRA